VDWIRLSIGSNGELFKVDYEFSIKKNFNWTAINLLFSKENPAPW